MIRTLGVSKNNELLMDFLLEEAHSADFDWYWVDFNQPTPEESKLLDTFFHFHPLAVEDCLHRLQRPKVDYYDGYQFFVAHTLNKETLEAEEIDFFIGKNFVVTFHHEPINQVDRLRLRFPNHHETWDRGAIFVMYEILDKIVDDFFPLVHKIEDELNEIEDTMTYDMRHFSMDSVFDRRSDLLWMRRTILPMRDLIYRVLNSTRLDIKGHEHTYFSDILDHLVRLTEIVDSNRELTADIRDSYMAMNSTRMNRIMMILTIISSIFIPLTFIAGVYGMNFRHMPELETDYGYFITIGIMVVIAVLMLIWFKWKGWFNLFRN
ncbi:magnesium/cobalt transporter CorA [Paenisporosarcina cavernae]|uniref:Magnesium transport protein CorA n=1 Tax=Paenisporosarcina cavernae TaxID=2320858 RepID=A0A385YVK9_9BACL|nr:magnesium/cobalt transporter CorA [Paenisporosarcina cavernae]AYC30511.1 magnesium and cobalt transport protein CorA [Paenisporosarcina cavernae]